MAAGKGRPPGTGRPQGRPEERKFMGVPSDELSQNKARFNYFRKQYMTTKRHTETLLKPHFRKTRLAKELLLFYGPRAKNVGEKMRMKDRLPRSSAAELFGVIEQSEDFEKIRELFLEPEPLARSRETEAKQMKMLEETVLPAINEAEWNAKPIIERLSNNYKQMEDKANEIANHPFIDPTSKTKLIEEMKALGSEHKRWKDWYASLRDAKKLFMMKKAMLGQGSQAHV